MQSTHLRVSNNTNIDEFPIRNFAHAADKSRKLISNFTSLQRYLFMKLTYYDSTPDDYEPPFFEAAGDRAIGAFTRKPFTM